MNIRSKNGTSVPQLGNCAQDPSRDPARVKSAGWMRSVAMRIVGGFGVLGTPARAGVAAAFLLVTLTAYAATNFPSPLTNTATVTVPAGTVNTNASCTNSGSSTLASQCTGSDSDTYSLDTVITKTGPASVIVGGAACACCHCACGRIRACVATPALAASASRGAGCGARAGSRPQRGNACDLERSARVGDRIGRPAARGCGKRIDLRHAVVKMRVAPCIERRVNSSLRAVARRRRSGPAGRVDRPTSAAPCLFRRRATPDRNA